MNLKKGLLLLIVIAHSSLFAQNFKKKDSLTAKLKNDSLHIYRFQKYRPYINIDQRNSFIKSAPININGLQLGILIKEKHVLGIGGYQITKTSKQKVNTKTEKNLDANRELDMRYLTLFYQYVAIDKRYFELDLQTEVGLGEFDIKLYDSKTNALIYNKKSGIFVSGIGPLFVIKPFKWIGFAGMAGYRFTFEKNSNLNFNGAFYGYGLWLDIRQIIRDYRYFLVKKRNYRKYVSEILIN